MKKLKDILIEALPQGVPLGGLGTVKQSPGTTINKNEIDVSDILKSIVNKVPSKTPFIDTTKCQKNVGYVEYKNDSLKVVFTEKTFNNKTDAVAYWQRRQWSFLGIKTRFLGKKEFTAKNYSECGETTVMKIEKKK